MPANSSNSLLQSTAEFFYSPFKVLNAFYRDLAEIDDRLHDDSIVVRLVCLVTIPFRMLGGLISLMVQSWPTSRSGRAFIIGAPALLTMAAAMGAWMLADYVYNEARMFNTNTAYYNLNLQTHPDTPESALSFAKKLVEIDPTSEELKYQLGIAFARAKQLPEAADIMRSLAPDNETGFPAAHIWRANYLSTDKTIDELKQTMGSAQEHLELAMAAEPNKAMGKFQQAMLYAKFANLSEEGSAERLDALVKADKFFQEIQGIKDPVANPDDTEQTSGEADDSQDSTDQYQGKENFDIRFRSLRPSTRIRKQLESIDSTKYDSAKETERVKRFVQSLMPLALRFNADRIQLWAQLVNVAAESRDFDYTLSIIDQAFEAAKLDDTKRDLFRLKSLVQRRAAISINEFSDHDAYHKRLIYLCQAIQSAPTDDINYSLLLQYVGNENPTPTTQFARANGLITPGEAVPVKFDWLLKSSADPKHTDIINLLIGLQQFHDGDLKSALKSWEVAERFNRRTREFLIKFCDQLAVRSTGKLNNVETILTQAIRSFPESPRFLSTRGLYFKNQQKFDLAILDFRKVLAKNPSDIILHKLIQFCFEYMGKPAEVSAEEQLLQSKLASMPPEAQSRAMQVLQQIEKNETVRNQRQLAPEGQ